MPVSAVTPDIFPLWLIDGGVVFIRSISEFYEWIEDAEGRKQQRITEFKKVVPVQSDLPRIDPEDMKYDGEDRAELLLLKCCLCCKLYCLCHHPLGTQFSCQEPWPLDHGRHDIQKVCRRYYLP